MEEKDKIVIIGIIDILFGIFLVIFKALDIAKGDNSFIAFLVLILGLGLFGFGLAGVILKKFKGLLIAVLVIVFLIVLFINSYIVMA